MERTLSCGAVKKWHIFTKKWQFLARIPARYVPVER